MGLSDLLCLPTATLVSLISAMLIAVAFEAVNGFHDAANAVATVIYTNSLNPRIAIIISGVCNFFGAYLGGVGVAFAIVHLLPLDLIVNAGSKAGIAMIFAILISAISWNLFTWYRGIPASSSHTLIGSIVGIGIADSLVNGGSILSGAGVGKIEVVMLSLLISPLLGFVLAGALIVIFQKWIKDERLYGPPFTSKPPLWARFMLLSSSAGVSIAHGSNDGQKGVGVIMIILIGILPTQFALNPEYKINLAGESVCSLRQMAKDMDAKQSSINGRLNSGGSEKTYSIIPCSSKESGEISRELEQIAQVFEGNECLKEIPANEQFQIRKKVLVLEDQIKNISRSELTALTPDQKSNVARVRSELRSITDYAPTWVILMVASAIGLGTMIGWKRVVVTVGERIGKVPLNYAQGVSSQAVAMLTISMADVFALPVSTTHVLSSGVTGSMVASRIGIKFRTIRDIALAWILTLPVTIFLSGALFLLFNSLQSQ